MRARGIHIVEEGSLWYVERDGERHPLSIHATKADALFAARQIAERNWTDVTVYDTLGRESGFFSYDRRREIRDRRNGTTLPDQDRRTGRDRRSLRPAFALP